MKDANRFGEGVYGSFSRPRTGRLSIAYGGVRALCVTAALALIPIAGETQTTSSQQATVVLVHRAWADASSFDAVVRQLQKAGYTAYALPNELRSLASDAKVISTFLNTLDGPVILAGHSYGGAVISVAAVGNPNVKALAYVDAFAPDAGESPGSLLAPYPAPPKDFFTAVPFGGSDADVYITQKYYGPVFASDVPAARAAAMAAEQRPLTQTALTEQAPDSEGWKTLPSWYVVGDDDLVIPPALQLKMAERAKSRISHTRGSHPSMIEHPEATVAAILAAISATNTRERLRMTGCEIDTFTIFRSDLTYVQPFGDRYYV
jgi:pimeloyl-ACP methyl ester carboxylesterase